MGYQFYKQLQSNNEYSPFDTPQLTPAAALYRSKTSLSCYKKSAAFGYPALRYRLNIPQEKLLAPRRPYKPAVTMPPRHPTNLRISTTPQDLAIVAGVEALENDCALARLREECDI